MGYLERMEELLITNPKATTKESYKRGCLKSTENFYNQEIRSLNMEKEFKISADDALKAYKNSDNYGKKILEDLFGKEFYKIDIKERVKCFEGAITALGMDNQAVKDYYAIARKTSTKDIIAFAKLRVIAEALNEGWKPNTDVWNDNYYSSFILYTKEEYEELEKKRKMECMVICRSDKENIYAEVDSKLAVSYVDSDNKISFKSRELARYCGMQFFDIWKDYLFG